MHFGISIAFSVANFIQTQLNKCANLVVLREYTKLSYEVQCNMALVISRCSYVNHYSFDTQRELKRNLDYHSKRKKQQH